MAAPATAFNFAGKTRDELGEELLIEVSKGVLSIDQPKALALIKAGANLEIRNEQEDTPLIAAAVKGHIAVGLALIAAKADVHAQERMGYNALMLSASGPFNELFDALLAADARILDANNEGETPYFLAAQEGETKIVEKLIKLNVPLDEPTKSGITARRAAHDKNFDDVVKLIDDSIFARDLPIRQEQERKAYALAHIGDRFRDGVGVDTVAPHKASFKPRGPRHNA